MKERDKTFKMKEGNKKSGKMFKKPNNKKRFDEGEIFKFKDESDESDDDNLEYLEKPKMLKKWFEEFKDNVKPSGNVNYGEIDKVRKEAAAIYNDAVATACKKRPKSIPKSDYKWIKTVMSKGTVGDKIAAYTLLIQDSPVYNLLLLRNLVGMVKVAKKAQFLMAMDSLLELFLNDLLPPNRKLLPFSQQPVSDLDKLAGGDSITRNRRLLLWYFEEELKHVYRDFITSLNQVAYDTIEANKSKAINSMHKLLAGHPEQESALLSHIVNKLGDPSPKIGSKVIYTLTKLLQTHPNMKEVVMEEVEKVIFRSNISKKAQYYGVCFLSQFCLTQDDSVIAQKLIAIYLSLFKACIKQGDVDTKMMSALLMGVNRAYPFISEELPLFKDQIDTIYKVVHLCGPNVAVQALSLLFLVSSGNEDVSDRFYTVLYKKIGEPGMFSSVHHAMFINLIYKTLKKDKDTNRIISFIKRLLQVSLYLQVPVICGLLYLISEIAHTKKALQLFQIAQIKEEIIVKDEFADDDDYDDIGREHYSDVKLPDAEEDEVDEKEKPDNVISNVIFQNPIAKNEKVVKIWCKSEPGERKLNSSEGYDPYYRNPLHPGAGKAIYTELLKLKDHFHPTVSLFASKIINKEKIDYTGDPLQDFTLIRFLDKFAFKNPKKIKNNELSDERVNFSKFDRKKSYLSNSNRRIRINTAAYFAQSTKNIPVEESFLFNYLKQRRDRQENMIKKEKPDKKDKMKEEKKEDEDKDEDESDVESVSDGEFVDFVEKMMGNSKEDDIDFMNELKVPKKDKKKGAKRKETKKDESDEDDDELADEGSFSGDDYDEDGDDIEDIDFGGDDLDGSEFDPSEINEKLEELGFNKKNKSKKKKDDLSGLFASAEEFSELLENEDLYAGKSSAFSNKDNAEMKQLKWEESRDRWIKNKNHKNKSQKRTKSLPQGKGNKKRRLK